MTQAAGLQSQKKKVELQLLHTHRSPPERSSTDVRHLCRREGGLAQTPRCIIKSVCLVISERGRWTLDSARCQQTHTHTRSQIKCLFPALLSLLGRAVRSAVVVRPSGPEWPVVMAAVQLGYSTESEPLSDTTMWAARHNTDALTGGTAGMLPLCLLAMGREGGMDWWKGRNTRIRREETTTWCNQITTQKNKRCSTPWNSAMNKALFKLPEKPSADLKHCSERTDRTFS